METLSTDRILEAWLADIGAGIRPIGHDGRRLSTSGYVVSGWGGWSGNADLCEFLPVGRGRPRPLFLITGDSWTSPPFQQSIQWIVRTAVQRGAAVIGADTLVVPFSALAAAGIDRATIRPLEVRPDKHWTEERTAAEWRHVPVSERTLTRTEERTAATLEEVPQRYRQWHYNVGRLERRDSDPGPDGLYRWNETVRYNRPRDEDGLYRWIVNVHRLGDSVFTADVVETRRRRREWTVLDVVRAAEECISAESADLRSMSYRTGTHSRETVRSAAARIADVDVEAPIVETETVTRRRRFVSSFDTLEPRWGGTYFLATLPSSSRARTVASAIEDLAPAAVHAAIARGRDVRRQGDIFFIGTDLSDEDLSAIVKTRARLTQWTRGAVPRPGEVGHRPTPSARKLAAMRRYRRRRFREILRRTVIDAETLAVARPRTDHGARRRFQGLRAERERILEHHAAKLRAAILSGDSYVARNHRRHYDAYANRPARDSHGNETVRQARDAYRRGYGTNAIAALQRARDETRDRFEPGARIGSSRWQPMRDRLRAALQVHGTAHSATEVVKAAGGAVYVRGIVRHVPGLARENRDSDHVPLRLEPGVWYLAVRNTVPRQRDTRRVHRREAS